ncbi:MAG: hypothetical protein WAJ85_07650, partial [Candidatus Baltobacteraceae bacterium]
RYERRLKAALYGRLHHRHQLMTFLERHPVRFDLLFQQFEQAPKLAGLIQRDRDDFSLGEWVYLYAQAAFFTLRALAVPRRAVGRAELAEQGG